MPKVFISYTRKDIDTARRLYNDLKKEGVSPWMDKEEIIVGQEWEFEVKRAIKECSYFLALLSNNSVSKKGFVQKELKIALKLYDERPTSEIFILPAIIDDCEPKDEMLQKIQWADFRTSYKEGLRNVLKAIGVERKPKKKSRIWKVTALFLTVLTLLIGIYYILDVLLISRREKRQPSSAENIFKNIEIELVRGQGDPTFTVGNIAARRVEKNYFMLDANTRILEIDLHKLDDFMFYTQKDGLLNNHLKIKIENQTSAHERFSIAFIYNEHKKNIDCKVEEGSVEIETDYSEYCPVLIIRSKKIERIINLNIRQKMFLRKEYQVLYEGLLYVFKYDPIHTIRYLS